MSLDSNAKLLAVDLANEAPPPVEMHLLDGAPPPLHLHPPYTHMHTHLRPKEKKKEDDSEICSSTARTSVTEILENLSFFSPILI